MVKAFRSKLCCEEFYSVHILNVHLEPQHEIRRDRRNKNVKCNVCGYELSTRHSLLNHMRTHTGERPFECTVTDCGKAFKDSHTLSDHIKSKHNDDSRQFKCEFPGCRYSAKTSSNLCHHKRRHSDKRPFPCPNTGCNYRAKQSGDLAGHVSKVHSSAAKEFGCSICDYKTAKYGDLKRHVFRHSERRVFRCSHPQCTKSFKSLRELEGHFKKRHEERNIRCDHPSCAKKFTALREHKRKRNVHAKRDHARFSLNSSLSTKKATTLAEEITVHEGSNKEILCSMDLTRLADSIGLACMLCNFVGYNVGAALDHARCHRQPDFPIDKLNEIPVARLD